MDYFPMNHNNKNLFIESGTFKRKQPLHFVRQFLEEILNLFFKKIRPSDLIKVNKELWIQFDLTKNLGSS